MERLAASMGGTIKWPYNDSECLDADFFKVGEQIDAVALNRAQRTKNI